MMMTVRMIVMMIIVMMMMMMMMIVMMIVVMMSYSHTSFRPYSLILSSISLSDPFMSE